MICAGHAPASEPASGVAAQTPFVSDAPKSCSKLVGEAESLNGPALFDAAIACVREGRDFDVSFLLIVGQIRSVADMALLTPAGDADEIAASQLYGRLYFQTGGAGNDEIYRDKVQTKQLFAAIEHWHPAFSSQYDPGWHFKPPRVAGKYEKAIADEKTARLAQLQWYASLIRMDDYYAATREMGELQRRNPRGFVAGTPDGDRQAELSGIMNRIARRIPPPAMPKAEPFEYEPDPDADFKQLLIGFGGPKERSVIAFENADTLKQSWLSRSLTATQLEQLLSAVDFEHQIVFAFAIGEWPYSSGTIYVTRVSYNALLDSLTVNVMFGVNEKGCKFAPVMSYPFAVAVAKRPAHVPQFPSNSMSNFADGCKQPPSGKPNTPG